MNAKLKKKLLKNAIETLSDYLGNEGCNDLSSSDGLGKGLSGPELKQIEKEFVKLFPKEARDYDNELCFDTQICDVLGKII